MARPKTSITISDIVEVQIVIQNRGRSTAVGTLVTSDGKTHNFSRPLDHSSQEEMKDLLKRYFVGAEIE
jgi:hypothetical protein